MPRSSTQLGYGYKWQKARARFLKQNPVCKMCLDMDRITPATVVDHIIPHYGDRQLFWDNINNWQSLCVTCHNKYKQSEERGGVGVNRGCDENGVPLDPNHLWMKK